MASRLKLKDILDFLGRFAPWDLAESWDNVGLMVGDPEQEVRGVLVALDPTMPVIDEALERGANIILTHHPLIFHPIKSINTATPFGRIFRKILSHELAVASCHTNLDIIEEGVSASLAHLFNLQNTIPLVPVGEPGRGFGKIGNLPEAMTSATFLRLLASRLKLTTITLAGPLPQTIKRVALCGGSGSEFAEKALQTGADIYLTAELKHATARWAEENRFCIVDASHFATENTVIPDLVSKLQHLMNQNNSTAPVMASQGQTSPLHHYFFDTSIR